ncbi:hypothetical protein [Bordetella petrii]|uniref:hypothetical protein n=1 Tax=Bordetella petrii TaxID=94624 RepID=UPI001E5AEEC3|nr:hypothetical protein [Bordetella petrii]MCD0503151.1 hypothetical protein [Bordetella petrii]
MRAFRRVALPALLVPIGLAGGPAAAQDAPDRFKTEIFLTPYSELGDGRDVYPRFNGRVLALAGYTNYFGIRDDNGQIPRSHWSSTQPQVEGAFVLQLTQRFSIRTKATLDSSTDETKDNVFSDLGMSLNNLFAAYTADNYALYGGKMDLGFGDAWHVIDGLYSGFTQGSEFRGSVGVGGRYSFGTSRSGSHSFAAALFKSDDSSLDKRLSFDDGVLDTPQSPAFSDQMKSFIVSYDFRNLPGLEGVSGGIDAGRLHAKPGYESANTVSARLRYDAPLANQWNLGWYNEATYSSAFLGTPVDSFNGVTSASFSRGQWQLTVTAAARNLMGGADKLARYGLRDGWDWGLSGAVTYVTPIGFIVQAGVTRQRDQSLVINQGVFRVAYQAEF